MATYSEKAQGRGFATGATVGAVVGCVLALHLGSPPIAILSLVMIGIVLGALTRCLMLEFPLIGAVLFWGMAIALVVVFLFAARPRQIGN
jgi:nucleoside phosphorylase